VLETMTATTFSTSRSLAPSSGFQSVQFRHRELGPQRTSDQLQRDAYEAARCRASKRRVRAMEGRPNLFH
jgi:tryptophan 2,3-dioxygenase